MPGTVIQCFKVLISQHMMAVTDIAAFGIEKIVPDVFLVMNDISLMPFGFFPRSMFMATARHE